MNYRHAFHAGNFADLLKHAVLLDLLRRLAAQPGPLTVIDTHAGAGLYDLVGPEAKRSGEAEAGIGRLMTTGDAPAVFEPLKAVVAALSPDGRLYPGSPYLAGQALRGGDTYIGHELRRDDVEALKSTLSRFRGARALQSDGYASAPGLTSPPPARSLVLIDPPFERPDDYANIVRTITAVRRRNRTAVIAVWLPIKDLDTLDAFQTQIEDLHTPGFLTQARLRPLDDPMKMNGCAMLVLGAPAGAQAAAGEAAEWIVRTLGQPGGKSVLTPVE